MDVRSSTFSFYSFACYFICFIVLRLKNSLPLSFVRLVIHSFVCLFVHLFVRTFVLSLVSAFFVRTFVRSIVRSFSWADRLFILLFVRLCVRSLVLLFYVLLVIALNRTSIASDIRSVFHDPSFILLQDVDTPYPWPLFSSYPPPKDYLPVEQISKMTAFEEGTYQE